MDAFREHKGETEEGRIQDLVQKGLKELQVMKVGPTFFRGGWFRATLNERTMGGDRE